jgi:hypothetical protein
MEISEDFQTKGYVHIQNLVSEDQCEILKDALKNEIDVLGKYDKQCHKSKFIKGSVTFDKLLIDMLPSIEEITGIKLLPTYAYARWYIPGEELKPHIDRESCEISVTLTLGFDGNPWSIFIADPSTDDAEKEIITLDEEKVGVKNISEIKLNVGDAAIYKGLSMYHWREEYKEGNWQAQVFLHYVDANGPYAEWKFDKKSSLLNKDKSVVNAATSDLTLWYYNDVLSSQDCDVIISSCLNVEKEKATIGDNDKFIIDESIRKVDKVILPTHKGIGAILSAIGINANAQRWKFEINDANQCEFLHYPSGGGRYKGHIDTFLSNLPENLTSCRKLTVLAFLNDDFKGGKFFLQTSNDRFYPPQEKGTILVFPSFILHGVEDVEEGERFSAVCWLVGPWFK